MSRDQEETQRLLLIDTCGDTARVALSQGSEVMRVEALPGRTASAEIVGALKRLLHDERLRLADLDGVGVVSGPGSFTGVRTGLATAKALCEAVGLRLASISRLEMLANAAGLESGFAVLDAGRGSLYVREVQEHNAREWLASLADFQDRATGAEIAVAEEKLTTLLEAFAPRLIELEPANMLPVVQHTLARGGTDVAWADANYIRPESEIYKRPCASEKSEAPR